MIWMNYVFGSGLYSLDSAPCETKDFDKTVISNAKFDEMFSANDITVSGTTIPSDWNNNTNLHAQFSGTLSAGNVDFYASSVTEIIIKRRKVGTTDWVTLNTHQITNVDDFSFEYFDVTARSNTQYEYALVPVISGTPAANNTATLTTDFDGMMIVEKDKMYISLLDAATTTQRNKTATVITTLNRRYPWVINDGINNYESGNATAVWMQYNAVTDSWDIDNAYKFRDEFKDFLMNGKPKLLKMWDGRMWLISVSGATVTDTQEEGYMKVTTAFDWTEVGDAENGTDLYNNGIVNAAQ